MKLTNFDYNFSLSDYRFFENPKREYTDFKRGRMNRHYLTTTSPFLTTGFLKILNASIVISNGVECMGPVRLQPDYSLSLSDYRFFRNLKREYSDFKRGRMNTHYLTTTSHLLTTGFLKILNTSIVISNGVE